MLRNGPESMLIDKEECPRPSYVAMTEESEVIESLFNNPQCGIAIVDHEFRYVRINNTLAKINGFAADFHIGKTLRDVLGDAAKEIERLVRSVFSTGKRVANFQLVAKLPTRPADGQWNVSYFPMRDSNGTVTRVCAIVSELEGTSGYHQKQTSPIQQSEVRLAHSLTKRQIEVIQYLANGKSNKEVAATLNITVRTVESYRKNIMEKLDIHSLADLVHFAIRHRIINI